MKSTYQRRIIHLQNYNSLMFRAIFAPSTNMGFDNIATIEERHLPIGLHPHLVPSMRSYDIQCCNVKSEFAGLCEPNVTNLVFCYSKLRYMGSHTSQDRSQQKVDLAARCWSLGWRYVKSSSRLATGACGIPCGCLLWQSLMVRGL